MRPGRLLYTVGSRSAGVAGSHFQVRAERLPSSSRPNSDTADDSVPGWVTKACRRVGGTGHQIQPGLAVAVHDGGGDDLGVAAGVRDGQAAAGPCPAAAGVSRLVSLPRWGYRKLFRVTPFARLAAQVMHVDYDREAAAAGRTLPGAGGPDGDVRADIGGSGVPLHGLAAGGWSRRAQPGRKASLTGHISPCAAAGVVPARLGSTPRIRKKVRIGRTLIPGAGCWQINVGSTYQPAAGRIAGSGDHRPGPCAAVRADPGGQRCA